MATSCNHLCKPAASVTERLLDPTAPPEGASGENGTVIDDSTLGHLRANKGAVKAAAAALKESAKK